MVFVVVRLFVWFNTWRDIVQMFKCSDWCLGLVGGGFEHFYLLPRSQPLGNIRIRVMDLVCG